MSRIILIDTENIFVYKTNMDLKTYTKEYGQSGIAERMSCSISLISQIVNGNVSITAERAIAIEKATDGVVTRQELRPDLWGKVKKKS